ncbi:MAG: hypothetical protein JWO43_595 [Candidatus Adlerbacteria bacterium]|nr:hypothetical protein [Candidatus Adlerbacteria bacterium]
MDVDLSQPVMECNCSHCQLKGLLLAFVPGSSLTIEQGEDNLTEYRFNTEKLQHLFCKTCGVQPFARGEKDGNAMYGVNVRTIDDIDIGALQRVPFDGKSR